MIARVILAAMILLSACGGDGDDFDEALRSGASCRALFDIRNEFDPDHPVVAEMNEQLREIGCFTANSERTDQ